MSDSTRTEPLPLRQLTSPFTGNIWTVPPDVTPELYAELVKRGFTPVEPPKRKDLLRDR